MKRVFYKFLLISLLFLTVVTSAKAYNVFFNGYISDEANIITPQKERILNEKIEALKTKTSAEIAIVTLKSLENHDIESIALAIGRDYGIGKKSKNNGLVILVAPNDRQARIEVGYGLEGCLNDAKAGRILDTYMLPYFKLNKYETGIENGLDTISSIISGETTADELTVSDRDILIFLLIIFAVIIILGILAKSSGNGGYYYYNNSSRNDKDDIFRGGGFGGGGFGGGGSSRKW